ncbi:MAG TPA: hypothetical protein DCS93_23080 [Microscillaceae bacterium]|nr:hypothetical protein [Microscillaceae bacterium]
MIIKNFLPFLFSILFLVACSTDEQSNGKKTMFDVESSKTKEHTRIPRSKIFAIIPDTYKFDKKDNLYRKGGQQYFTMIEGVGMQKKRIEADKLEQVMKNMLIGHAGDITFYEKIKVNSYTGAYFEGGFQENGAASIGVWFGDDTFWAAFVGVYPADDEQEKIDLLNILATLYYDEKFTIDPNEFSDFTFDSSISGFKFNTVSGERLVYTPTGKETSLYEVEAYLSFSSGPIYSELAGEIALRNVLLNMSTLGITFQSKDYKKVKLGERTALLLESEIQEKEHKQFLYSILIIGSERSVLMYAVCNLDQLESPNDLKKYREIFHKTAQSIKF